ncbi:hypothetical protein DXG01_005927 [Tephrocybe rancida]|nr:hypothetical protein DXG01_005927 [Tephrocybe rancida]
MCGLPHGLFQYMFSAYMITSVVCDVTITLSLVYFLNIMRSGFRNSGNLINQLVIFRSGFSNATGPGRESLKILHSINIGLLTSAIATCTLITYLASPTLLFSGIYAINARGW